MPTIVNDSENIHVPEVQEILGTPPYWLLHSGMTLFFLAVFMLLAVTWFVKYPDTISAKSTLTAEAPPITMVAKKNGKLLHFPAHEGQMVETGELLAILESSFNYLVTEEVHTLVEKDFHDLQPNDLKAIPNLGELQPSYDAFKKSFFDLQIFHSSDYYKKKISFQQKQIAENLNLRSYLDEQMKLVERDLIISQQDYDAENSLYKNNIIPTFELFRSESSLLGKKSQYIQAQTSKINAEIQINELKKSLMELELEKKHKEKELLIAFEQSKSKLKSDLLLWEHNHIIKAPISGKVTLHKFRVPNQNVKTGDEVLTIVPENHSSIFCQAELPISGSGKVKQGQEVHIKLESFPYNEFGYIAGEVESVSLTPYENNYVIRIKLTNGLVTNYGHQLPFKQEITGTADIITNDLRLLERFFNNLKSLQK
jgi:multidrug efflux pump subunit AcrA (membrane-fusion protein)